MRLKDLRKLGSAPLIQYMNKAAYKMVLGKKYKLYSVYDTEELKVMPQIIIKTNLHTQFMLSQNLLKTFHKILFPNNKPNEEPIDEFEKLYKMAKQIKHHLKTPNER